MPIALWQMFGKKLSTQTTKLYMTPTISSSVNPGARNFQEEQQNVNRTVAPRWSG